MQFTSSPSSKLHTRLLLHQLCMTSLSERGESIKTNANKVSYEALYETLFALVLFDSPHSESKVKQN